MSSVKKETEENKNNKKIWLGVILTFILVLVLFVGYFVYKDLKQEEILRKEVDIYVDKDLAKDEYLVEIKTEGDYAVLEGTIKTYLRDFSDIIKEFDVLMSDEDFYNILSAENYKNDGPEFVSTLAKISFVRDESVKKIDTIVLMSSEDYMLSLIDSKNLDDYYVDLYEELLYGEDGIEELESVRDELVIVKNDFIKFLDKCEEIILFLKDNKGSWVIENDNIVFRSDSLYNRYNKLIEELS